MQRSERMTRAIKTKYAGLFQAAHQRVVMIFVAWQRRMENYCQRISSLPECDEQEILSMSRDVQEACKMHGGKTFRPSRLKIRLCKSNW